MRWLVVVAIAACSSRTHVGSCDDSLAGVWRTPAGERWVMLDNGATLEAYPMFDDALATSAPRFIDLQRRDGQLLGEVTRRTMRRADVCEARATVQIATCHDDQLEIDLGDVPAPTGFAPCQWPTPAPRHVDRWRR